jgi:ADP-heptose:LPS heptosyltransferase
LTAAGGSSHIASSLNLSVIVLSGIKNQDFWRPYGEKIKIFENEISINRIDPSDIIKSIKKYVK